jgi:OOP family OmpA-OmpF porin
MLKKFAAASALAVVTSSSLAAALTTFYAGLDLGSTKIANLDSNKTSFGGFVGYRLNQNFAVELGYRRLGKWEISNVDLTVKQIHLAVVESFPLNDQLDVYGRLGYNQLRTEASYGKVTAGENTHGGLYGIGLNYRFAPNISARLEVQKPASDTTNYGVGVVWNF